MPALPVMNPVVFHNGGPAELPDRVEICSGEKGSAEKKTHTPHHRQHRECFFHGKAKDTGFRG